MKKKIVAIILIVALLASMLTVLAACNNKDAGNGKKDKAIIYVTALFSGGLYDSEKNEAVWEPFSKDFQLYDYVTEDGGLEVEGLIDVLFQSEFYDEEGEDMGLLAYVLDVLTYEKGTLLYDMTLDQDGNPYNANIVPANNSPKDKKGNVMDISCGVFGIYKPFLDGIRETYGKDYEVECFNYDWRYSPADAAAKLEEYINHWGYKEVILMSHSMGAPTVCQYLARSEANREKVKLYMGFAPATMGSYDALCALSCLGAYANNFIAGAGINPSDLPINIDEILAKALTYGGLGDFFFNNMGLMTLTPSWQFYNSDQYADGTYGIYVDGTPITTKEALYDFYETSEWALYRDENGDPYKTEEDISKGIYVNKDGYRIKKAVATLADYYDSFYIDTDNDGVKDTYVPELINSYYFVGTGLETTITGLNVTTGGTPYDYSDDTYVIVTGANSDMQGDGTVPYYASIGGMKTTEVKNYQSRIIKYEEKNHLEVGGNYKMLQPKIFELIKEVVGY